MIKITESFIKNVTDKSKIAKRGRCNYNFHKSFDEKVQRFLNIADPGTYIRPHKHENPDKTEVFIILKGKAVMLEFSRNGKLVDYAMLDSKSGNFGAEVPPGVYHSFISLKKGTAVYEIKEGPFDPTADKLFAPWAPDEGTKEAQLFNKNIILKLKL